MKSIIIGTAGHVDHGKTSLVKALTGIDADRLEEEKRRGITIDLGFAHVDLTIAGGETLRLAFVDVPGHERFVRNMLAGIAGIDLVLLVIAADESIKPQTREHFDILQLVGVQRGITVLTKADAVDSETLDVVRLEVEEFLRGTFLATPESPIVAVSSLTGQGLDDLKHAILAASQHMQDRDPKALARLPVDRVFSMKGFGTVVTGTLLSGTIRREDELEVFPSGRRVRVRGAQVHGQSADLASAGQRTALNLAGATTEDLSRGMMLAPPMTLVPTKKVDVLLRLLPSAPHPLKDRVRVHFHAYAMETVAEIVFHRQANMEASRNDARQMAPGSEAFARIKLPDPALLIPGDHFIIRQFSPVITIGGGLILDANPMPGQQPEKRHQLLEASAAGDKERALVLRIQRRGANGLSLSQAIAETGWTGDVLEAQISTLRKKGEVTRFGDVFLHSNAVAELLDLLPRAITAFHKENPLVAGMGKETLANKFELAPEVFASLLDMLVREKKVEVNAELVRLPGHVVVMRDDEAESKKTIEYAFAAAGLKVPALPEVIAGLKIDKPRAQKLVTLLLRDKVLVKISDDLVFHREAIDQLRRQVGQQKTKSPKLDVAAFKEMTGVSRKYAIPLLEYLDRERVTRRVGDTREIL